MLYATSMLSGIPRAHDRSLSTISRSRAARGRAAAARRSLRRPWRLRGHGRQHASGAFVDPAKYENFDCKQLEAERKSLATRTAELQGLMAKAETGTGGAVVVEMAYRNDYISARAQAKLAEEVWQRNKCVATLPAAAAPAAPPPAAPALPRATARRDQAVAAFISADSRHARAGCRAVFTPASRRSSPAAPACAAGRWRG